MKAILEHQKKHNVICSARTIYRLLERLANGNTISGQFTGKGRPTTISDAEVKQIAQSLKVEVGKTYTGSDVELMIKKMQAENVESDGFKPIIEKSISRWTVKNYTAMLAKESNIAILQSYISKSKSRYAAENSIHGSVATLGVITTTHFITIDKENDDIRAKIKSLPAATRKMHDMVTDYFGSAVYPVEPYLVYSTDDTTEYIFEGTKQAFVPYVLTSTSSVSKHCTNALYKCKDNQSMSEMQVKLTFTFSAMGTCFPLVCTITGLTEREMPTGEEFIQVKVPGLCIGGGGVNINNAVVGQVLFMRILKESK
jgi:hypothetical protein